MNDTEEVVVEDDDDDDDDEDDDSDYNHSDHHPSSQQSRWQQQRQQHHHHHQQQRHSHQYYQQQPQQHQHHAHPTTTTASRSQQEAMQDLFESMSFDLRSGDQGGRQQQQQRQQQRHPTYSPATTVHNGDVDDDDVAVEEVNYKTNHHINDNNSNINLSRHTKTNQQQQQQQHQRFQSSGHSHHNHHRQQRHFRSDSNAADDENEANRNDDYDDNSSAISDDGSASLSIYSSFDSKSPNHAKDGNRHHHHRNNNNSQDGDYDDDNDDDHNDHSASAASSSSTIKSYLDAGYSNEEDYLFDQYGGVGGTAEERSELATALAHTLNVGPMADELFYEEVAMCFLRCRERHRMRVRREERRRNSKKMGEKKMKKNKKKEKNVSKGIDEKRTNNRMENVVVDEKKENGANEGVQQGRRERGGERMDGMRERVAVEAVGAAMKMRASGGNGSERVAAAASSAASTDNVGGEGEGGGGGGGKNFSNRSSLTSREIFDEYDDSDDSKEDDTTLLRERMSRMNVRDHPRRINSMGRGGVAGVFTSFPSATNINTTATTTTTATPTATGVESEFEQGRLNDTEDDDDDYDSLSRISDSMRNMCNVESDYEDVQRYRYRRRISRGRKDEKVATEEDGGVQDEDLSMPSTPISSADEKDDEDSFMNGKKFNDAKLFHTMSGARGGGQQNNVSPDIRIATPTNTNRVQAEMERDDGDEIAFDNMTRDSDDDDGSNVGHIHGHPKDPMFQQQQQQQQHKAEPLFRVDLKSGGPPVGVGGGVAARNLKKGYNKKGGGGSNRFPPPPPPRPGVNGGALGGNIVDPVQQHSQPQQQQQQEQYQAQTPSPMDVDDEQKPPWEEKMARAARAAAEASALKNDHESLRRDFSMGVPVAGPTNNTKNNDGRKISAVTGGGGMGGKKHRSALSSGSGTNGQPGLDGGGGGAEFSSKRHDVTRMSLHDDMKLMSGDGDDEESLKNHHVAHLRDEGRTFYINGAYYDSVVCYTEAIRLRSTHFHDSKNDAILAALYGNRAAALMMTGAYEGASADCERALLCTDANSVDAYESLESGPAFRSKILCRMARALLKAGDIWDAEKAFNNSVQSAKEALVMVGHQSQAGVTSGGVEGAEETRGMEKILNQSITDATLGLSDVRRYRDAVDSANSMETSKGTSSAADRRSSVQLLMSINSALSISPGCIELHERKVSVLASLKRWAELANHCERFAAESVKFDGLFSDDLSSLNPFPDVRPAHSLKADFFEKNPDDLLDPASMRILSPKAVCEAVVRMPNGILLTYLRSLRLEERYTEAAKAGSSIEAHMSETKHRGSRGNVSITWLSTERDKLRRTMSWKEMGDALFRNGDYERAGEKYAQCLTIDNELTYNHTLLVNENAGGRLHAVLHCNRAACLMALKKYREAVKECTAALRIHTHYMKAMLRRGRCFARIRQYEEAIAEYERYIQLVIEARKSPQNATNNNAACTFDRPMDITEVEYNKAKQELVEVKKSMRNAAAQEQAQEKKQREQQFNFNKNFKAAANDAARRRQEAPPPRESAFTRKKQWEAAGVNQRPWDTFDGTSPKKMNGKNKPSTREPPMSFHPSGGPNAARKYPNSTARDANRPYQQPQQKHQQQQQQPRHQQQQQQQQQQPPTPISKPTDAGDHYQVLGLLPTATATEIKKAYHKMALKYHPDKNSEEDAADIFRRVKLAYEVLGNEQSRVAYDSLRRGGRR